MLLCFITYFVWMGENPAVHHQCPGAVCSVGGTNFHKWGVSLYSPLTVIAHRLLFKCLPLLKLQKRSPLNGQCKEGRQCINTKD